MAPAAKTRRVKLDTFTQTFASKAELVPISLHIDNSTLIVLVDPKQWAGLPATKDGEVQIALAVREGIAALGNDGGGFEQIFQRERPAYLYPLQSVPRYRACGQAAPPQQASGLGMASGCRRGGGMNSFMWRKSKTRAGKSMTQTKCSIHRMDPI